MSRSDAVALRLFLNDNTFHMPRVWYAVATLAAFLAVLWIRIRLGPLLALCLVGAAVFIAFSIGGYYVAGNAAAEGDADDERKHICS